MKSKILVAAIIFTTVSALSFGALSASANFWAGDTDMTKTFAQKLGVSEDKVKEAMTSMRTEHQAEMKADLASKLTQAVKDGKITQAQKEAILTKFGEAKMNMKPEAFRNMTAEERKAEMEKKRAESEAWAKANNLDLTTLKELVGHGKGGRGFMKPM